MGIKNATFYIDFRSVGTKLQKCMQKRKEQNIMQKVNYRYYTWFRVFCLAFCGWVFFHFSYGFVLSIQFLVFLYSHFDFLPKYLFNGPLVLFGNCREKFPKDMDQNKGNFFNRHVIEIDFEPLVTLSGEDT